MSRGVAARAAVPPSPLIAVPNVTAHPSTASVPTSYYSMWRYNYFCTRVKQVPLTVCCQLNSATKTTKQTINVILKSFLCLSQLLRFTQFCLLSTLPSLSDLCHSTSGSRITQLFCRPQNSGRKRAPYIIRTFPTSVRISQPLASTSGPDDLLVCSYKVGYYRVLET